LEDFFLKPPQLRRAGKRSQYLSQRKVHRGGSEEALQNTGKRNDIGREDRKWSMNDREGEERIALGTSKRAGGVIREEDKCYTKVRELGGNSVP